LSESIVLEIFDSLRLSTILNKIGLSTHNSSISKIFVSQTILKRSIQTQKITHL